LPPSPREPAMRFTRLGSHIFARLDRSTRRQDHTVLPYAKLVSRHSARQRDASCCAEISARRTISAVRLRAASGSRGLPTLPAPLAPDAAASTASPARDTGRRSIALLVSRDARNIRHTRISVKYNIFTRRGLTRCFARRHAASGDRKWFLAETKISRRQR
jgi:hypothetical protein